MTIPTFNAVGFCANYSKQGDWAFDFALQISQTHKVQLNVFIRSCRRMAKAFIP